MKKQRYKQTKIVRGDSRTTVTVTHNAGEKKWYLVINDSIYEYSYDGMEEDILDLAMITCYYVGLQEGIARVREALKRASSVVDEVRVI